MVADLHAVARTPDRPLHACPAIFFATVDSYSIYVPQAWEADKHYL